MKFQRAVYAGSFDPFTNGHFDIAFRGMRLFDELVIAVGENPKKNYTLTLEQRMGIIEETMTKASEGLDVAVRVTSFQGLLVEYCRQINANIILRGLRAVTDFEFEFQIGLANMDMIPSIETVFLLSEPSNIFISSSLIKEIAYNGGNVDKYLPEPALNALKQALL